MEEDDDVVVYGWPV